MTTETPPTATSRMNKSQEDDSKMMDAAVMLSSMSWLTSVPPHKQQQQQQQRASSKSASSAEKPEEEESNGGDNISSNDRGDNALFLGLILAADIASAKQSSSRKRKEVSSKGPTANTAAQSKKEATGDGRAKKPRSTKASTTRSSSKKQKTPGAAAKPRRPKAMASSAAGAASPQDDTTQVAGNLELDVNKQPPSAPVVRIRARGATKKRIEELESQLATLRKHATKLEQENESLKTQMKDMVMKKARKPAATKRKPKVPAAPSRSTKVSPSTTFEGTKSVSGLPVEIAMGKAKTERKPGKTTVSGRDSAGAIRPNQAQQQQGLLSINMPALRDAQQQHATLKTPPVVTPPLQTTTNAIQADSNSIAIENAHDEFQLLLAALLSGGGQGLGTSQEKQRQEQDAQQQQQQQQQVQGFHASADNNFNQSPTLQSQQQEPSFAEFLQQQLVSLQTQQQQAASAAHVKKTDADAWSLLAAPKEHPQQGKHSVVAMSSHQEQSDQSALLAWLLLQQLQQSSSAPGPSKPETNGHMPNQQEHQSPRTVSQVFTVPEQQQQHSFATTETPRSAAVSPVLSSVASNSATTNTTNTSNVSTTRQSSLFLKGHNDFQPLQNYFTPEALLAILGVQQH